MIEFSQKDLDQIEKHGLSLEQIEKQMENFKRGFPFVNIDKPAVIGDGILRLEGDKLLSYVNFFEACVGNLSIVKFVPASGAATRMFKDLYDFKSSYDSKKNSLEDFPKVKQVIENISQFAFYESLKAFGVEKLLEDKKYLEIIEFILEESGLGYGQSPKAVIEFHKYDDEVRTAFEEHLVEAAEYCVNNKEEVNLHFTISENHKERFSALLERIQANYEKQYGCKYKIDFSVQKSSTDTIAVNQNNVPARDDKGLLIFRPSGHGALIENLNEIDADIIFIKNIDNVIHDKYKAATYKYKKLLGGILMTLRNKVFDYLQRLSSNDLDNVNLSDIIEFCEKELAIQVKSEAEFENRQLYIDYLISILDRPIRVCGMVKNENQPGGGPFWIKNVNGDVSLQIVESAQVDMKDELQKQKFNQSTHFNPVDIVCSVKRFNGKKINLTDFVDYQTGFITEKTQKSQILKAQELPGLWNGSMAKWISIFVETPLETFTPVKIVNNLLDKGHNVI